MNISSYSRVWVTSDTHFGHANIIKYCDRPFTFVNDMDEHIINSWNNCVGDEDLVIHLGDVAFKGKTFSDQILPRLKGRKLLIKGNHDKRENLEEFFSEGIYDYLYISRGKRQYTLFHFPIESWDGKYHDIPHLHGHCHGTVDNSGLLRFDMGWDVWESLVDLDWLGKHIEENKYKYLSKTPPIPFRDTFFKKLYLRAVKEEGEETLSQLNLGI